MVKVGDKYNRLTVVGITHIAKQYASRNRRLAYAVCICDCGKKVTVRAESVEAGLVKSCGCLNKEIIAKRNKESATHGMSNTRLYHIYASMKARCGNPNHQAYQSYGGRGITVCEEWEDFTNFAKWALENGYAAELTIDRIDNEKGYSPDNCRWVGMKEQERNRRDTVWIEYDGEKYPLAELAEKVGIERTTLWKRIKSGWDVQDALFTPADKANAHGVKVRPVVTAELCSSWMDVKKAALATMNLTAKTEPTDEWKREMILADHSPLRRLRFWVEMKNIPYSVSVHLVRHFTGVIHFVGTQRTDRCNGIDRSLLPQGIPVNHCMEINAPEVIFISKRRLCMQASPETREVWRMVVDAIGKVEPIIAEFCHPPCWWYGGRCPEMKPCGMFPKFDPTFSPVPLAKVGK